MNKSLAKKINSLARADQKMRIIGPADFKIDAKNTASMKKIIAQYGWPTISLVGEKAAHMAWLLAQHADHDIQFQKRCLKLMFEKLAMGEASPQDVAYLTDRIRVKKNLPQIFGTQFKKDKSGKYFLAPIINPKQLNIRRKLFGLTTIGEYKRSHSRQRHKIIKKRKQ